MRLFFQKIYLWFGGQLASVEVRVCLRYNFEKNLTRSLSSHILAKKSFSICSIIELESNIILPVVLEGMFSLRG